MEEEADQMLHPPSFEDNARPTSIICAPELSQTLPALKQFFSQKLPPKMLVCLESFVYIRYGFANSSGTGLGSSITTDEGIWVRIGTWGVDSEDDSSNWREFENLVMTLEAEEENGNLDGAALVICTNNSTAEAAANKATSTSPKLYRLAVWLKALQFRCGAQFIILHVAGERMKDQGTDGVSRGHLKEGVAAGREMIEFVPFHRSALDVSSRLKAWVMSWAPRNSEFLDPSGWFERGHDHDSGQRDESGHWRPSIRQGTFVWTPLPGAARIAIKQLHIARTKRQDSLHIVCIPTLLTHEWSRQLWKASDVVFEAPRGSGFWPKNFFESLTIGILFPFIPHRPWQLRQTPKMFFRGEEDAQPVTKPRSGCREFSAATLLGRWEPSHPVRKYGVTNATLPIPRSNSS
jgi:hypothetical protein